MKVSIQRTSATEVDIAGFHSVTQSVTVVARTPRRTVRSARRTGTSAVHRTQATSDGLVEITLVRSVRNRLGGGARARPALVR